MEKELEAKKLQRFAALSTETWFRLYEPGKDDQEIAKSPKLGALKNRLAAVEARLVERAGDAAKMAYGDGKRVKTAAPDALEEAEAAIKMCEHATDTSGVRAAGDTDASILQDHYKKYQAKLAHAAKIDPNVLAHRSVRMKVVACEYMLGVARLDFDDDYQPQFAKSETEKGCGKQTLMAAGVQIGSGKFAPYARLGVTYAEKIDCKKLAKKSNAGKAFKAAIREYEEQEGVKTGVYVVNGKPYVKEQDDGRLYQMQDIDVYAKDMELAKNPCGGEKTFCEAGGSKSVAALNRLEHALDRAELHAGKDPDRCKKHLKEAKAQAAQFDKLHASAVKSGDWVSGATYKTRKGAKLSEKELLAAFATKGKLADDRSLDDYCAKPSK
jgi:hypothetical protein